MKILILCDFDGTISTVDTTDLLLQKHASPEWKHWESLWENGEITSQECMKRQVELIDASLKDIDSFAKDISIEKDFSDFYYFCKRNGYTFATLSDGVDYLIHGV